MTLRISLLAAVVSLSAALAAAPAPAQDVEMLGRVYGTRPPDAYYEAKRADPAAFNFSRGWARRTLRAFGGDDPGSDLVRLMPGAEPRALLRDGGTDPASAPTAALTLGPRGGAVVGTFRVPLVLGLFADSPSPSGPFSATVVEEHFFRGPNPTGTITDFYREVSGGRVELVGDVMPWRRTGLTKAEVTGGTAALGSSRLSEFIVQVLDGLPRVDWGLYDNDGPDGVPNSGDDDGYVDVLTVMHPDFGAECGGDDRYHRVWSHRFSLSARAGVRAYVTGTPSANGGFIRVDDYTIQPVISCDETSINEIGVFAHELGHAFGLPDLYATGDRAAHSGSGQWDLMGTGSWGCSGHGPERPCHLGAWSKSVLGWADVETLPRDADLSAVTLDPVESGGTVYRVDAGDGSGEFFLLENRQRLGFDDDLPSPGLLVWHVDEPLVLSRWAVNAVNSDRRHMGVWLRQADGRNDLAAATGGNRGDDGDPFPGSTGATAFHAGTPAAAVTHDGEPAGVTLLDIQEAGSRVRFRLLTRYNTLTVRTRGAEDDRPLLTVDGVALGAGGGSVPSAPFQVHDVRAAGGEALADGVRRGFAGWDDDPSAPRERHWRAGLGDGELTAAYGGREVRVRMPLGGGADGIAPGEVVASPASPDFWFPEGTEVSFSAEPRTGFAFVGWQGALAGRPNPTHLTLAGPVDAGATFEVIMGVEDVGAVTLEAATPQEIVLQAAHANAPLSWRVVQGRLPAGLGLEADGVIEGAALETGTFRATVEVVDGIGLRAAAALTLEVTPPVLGVAALTAPFFLDPDGPTALQEQYLDQSGNRNGAYDLGDFRAYVLDVPDLPMTASERALVRTLVPLVDLRPVDAPPGGPR